MSLSTLLYLNVILVLVVYGSYVMRNLYDAITNIQSAQVSVDVSDLTKAVYRIEKAIIGDTVTPPYIRGFRSDIQPTKEEAFRLIGEIEALTNFHYYDDNDGDVRWRRINDGYEVFIAEEVPEEDTDGEENTA